MVNFTEEQFLRHELRRAPKIQRVDPPDVAQLESKLHDDIESELKRRRWYYTHSRMDRRATNTPGTTDFIIAIPGGKTLWCEAKRRGAKLTKEQNITRHILLASGHWYEVVFSFAQFLKLL